MSRRPRISPLLPYTTLCRSYIKGGAVLVHEVVDAWRLGDPFGEELLLRFDTPRATAPEHRSFSHALYPGRAKHPEEFQAHPRSEEHKSELQSRQSLVCRLLL